MPTNFSSIMIVVDGFEVGEARNRAIETALKHEPKPEFVFSLDYDVIASYDALIKLVYRARCFPDYDIFAGVYCSKSATPEPLIYKGSGVGPFWDWTVGDLITEGITGVHMGLTLVRTSLFERLTHDETKPWFLTTERVVRKDANGGLLFQSGTEDLYFCKRATEEVGAKILIDTSVLAGHINHETGQIFGLPEDSPPILRCPYMNPKKPAEGELKRCLDIGAGRHRRVWEGYKTFTLDLRPDVKPDFVQDSRLLNFPDNEWDMLASSHHLEHIGRWDQERVWGEMFRITKPGGTFEHVVPNIEWAAWKVNDGQADEHAFNVLYGAQENHGYERELNTHYFGYTPAIARSLAEQAGFVDVKTEDYKQNPELAYNLIITGKKPEWGQPCKTE